MRSRLNSQRSFTEMFADMKKSKVVALIFLLVFILASFVYSEKIDRLDAYAMYIFDALFTIIVVGVYRKQLNLKLRFDKSVAIQMVLSFALGFLVYRLAVLRSMTIPFNLNEPETILFLILIGPILEEFLFRQALWSSIQTLADNRLAAYLGTSLLFAFAHFHAYFFVDDLIRPFIVYQTGYVFIIALWWGFNILKHRSILTTILFHIAFNTGFLAASHI